MSIKARLERLERKSGGDGVHYTIEIYPDETSDQALEFAGIKPQPGDLVVLLKQYGVARPPNHTGFVNKCPRRG